MSLQKFLTVLASKIEIEIYAPRERYNMGDRTLFRGRCEVARENFPCDAYKVVYVSFLGSEGICRILVQERRRK